ncbi:MAG: energy transducer TonB [Bacteroidales bacterium]|nr:energy transducer TonB [Bacteroidales bacterium]
MEQYQRTREKRERNSIVTGITATLLAHALVLVFFLTSGFTYLDPPPPERTSLLIEFEEDPPQEKIRLERSNSGTQPQAREIDPEREVELVQKSESPHVDNLPNVTPATRPDPHGDVDVPTPEPEKEPELDPRASFPGMAQKDNNATTPHTAADQASPSFKAGQAEGNVTKGKTDGAPNAHVQGRSVIGKLPHPAYNSQVAGTVVVTIKVDQYGNVVEAVPGAEGTTVTDKSLWTAARNAAMKAHFNMAADAPALQTGTITYIFKLK